MSTDARLARTVIPQAYELTIRTDLDKLRFAGTAVIAAQVRERIEHVTLHAAEPLKVKNAVLKSAAGRFNASNVRFDKSRERLHLSFGKAIEPGDIKLGFLFEGVMDDSMMGYYRSVYESADGKTAYFGMTQFEPTQARRAFPCFDEPSFKAEYSMTMISRKDTVSLSNMPVVSTKSGGSFPLGDIITQDFVESAFSQDVVDDKETEVIDTTPIEANLPGDWETVSFDVLPKTSTYLVTYANGPFDYVEDFMTSPLTGRTIPLRVYATKKHIPQTKLALATTKRMIPLYEKLFNIPFPLPKMDTLVSESFDAGAMEGFGLITGRVSVYLFDEKQSGLSSLKDVVAVQSHELAHQWFGNLVTMDWWDNLWLNEAFATLMGEAITIEKEYPEWAPQEQFVSSHLKSALQLDALRSSHPIEMPCPDEDTIQQIFDAISYSKGASVLRMLANAIGQDTFLKGVSLYLKGHLYGNSRTKDLWNGISEASGQDVAAIMQPWVEKIGFPLITVTETPNGLHVRQNRFLSAGNVTPDEDTTLWNVPLELKVVDPSGSSTVKPIMLSTREMDIPLDFGSISSYKLNADSFGVFRVLYPESRLKQISSVIGAFSPSDRAGLTSDAWVLAQAGFLKTSAALSLSSSLTSEKKLLVWQTVFDGLAQLASVWWEQPEPIREAIEKLRRSLSKPLVQHLGYENSESDDPETIELRTLAVSTAAAAKDSSVLAEFDARFKKFLKTGNDAVIPSDIRTPVYRAAIENGSSQEYEAILGIYKNPPTPDHQISAMLALCAASDPALQDRTFDLLFNGGVKLQDMMYFFAGLSRSPYTRRRLWAAFKENYDSLISLFKGNFSIGRLVRYSFDSFSSKKDLEDVKGFFADKSRSAYDQSYKQGVDVLSERAAWVERDAADVTAWFK